MIRLVIDGLLKRYDGVAVIDNLSLEVPPGELTYILGPAGAGKTTLARLVAGLDKADAGEIYLDGRPIQALPPAQRKVGLTFTGDALWPQLTVAENVAYGLRIQKLSRRERRYRVQEILSALRIESLADSRPNDISPLQRRRTAFARALAIEPDVLLLDEPLAGLDGRPRDEARDEIRRLQTDHDTTLVVFSDDPRDALASADRLVILDLGRIAQVDAPERIYNHPADPFVAQYLGPVNLFQGQVDSTQADGETIVRTPIGRLVGHSPEPLPSAGQPVTVAIRPESIELLPGNRPDTNRFPATLEREVSQGAMRILHLRGPGEWPVLAAALPNQTAGLRTGQALTLSVPIAQILVLPSRHGAPVG